MKHRKYLSLLLTVLIIITSFPLLSFASELPLCENIILHSTTDGETSIADLDTLLDDLLASFDGRSTCDDTDWLINGILSHQQNDEPLYVTRWFIHQNQAISRDGLYRFSGRYTEILLFTITSGPSPGTSWWITNRHSGMSLDIFGTARLYRNWNILQDQNRFDMFLAPGATHHIHLSGSLDWDRTTLSKWNGWNHFFYIARA